MSKAKTRRTRRKRRQQKMKGGTRTHARKGGRSGSVFSRQLGSRRK